MLVFFWTAISLTVIDRRKWRLKLSKRFSSNRPHAIKLILSITDSFSANKKWIKIRSSFSNQINSLTFSICTKQLFQIISQSLYSHNAKFLIPISHQFLMQMFILCIFWGLIQNTCNTKTHRKPAHEFENWQLNFFAEMLAVR